MPRGFSKGRVKVHTFPCPWHTWAYATAKSMHVVDAANRSAVLPWLRLVFANQDAFFNDGPYSTPAQVEFTDRRNASIARGRVESKNMIREARGLPIVHPKFGDNWRAQPLVEVDAALEQLAVAGSVLPRGAIKE